MRAVRLAVAALALAWAGGARAAADAFLCTPSGVPVEEAWLGESTDTQYKNCVQFEWMGFGAALGPTTGNPGTPESVLGPLVFQTHLDSNFPKLLAQSLNGTVFDVDLFVRTTGASTWRVKVSFVDAVVGDLQIAGSGGDVPKVTVAIRARTVTYTTRTFDTLGNQTGEFTTTWTAPGP